MHFQQEIRDTGSSQKLLRKVQIHNKPRLLRLLQSAYEDGLHFMRFAILDHNRRLQLQYRCSVYCLYEKNSIQRGILFRTMTAVPIYVLVIWLLPTTYPFKIKRYFRHENFLCLIAN
jgi:hypothetical protein